MEYFITGVDTDIGKTFITKGLALKLEKEGKKIGVFKPLQSSAIETPQGLLAPDLEAIKELSTSINTKYSYIFKGDVSPALAARLSSVKIDLEKIKKDFNSFKQENDITLVEGAGGILAPATDTMLCADLIKELNIPIIIVTVPFLGRLNHTLLTIHYAKTNNIPIKGIIINKIPNKTNDLATQNFIDELKHYTDVNIIGQIKEINNLNILEEFNSIKL
jgi:dethiobiotin synthetase